MVKERETYLVFNPGPPRKKKRSKKRNPAAQYNEDLVAQLEFLKVRVGSLRLDDTDRALIRHCMRRISDIIIQNRA